MAAHLSQLQTKFVFSYYAENNDGTYVVTVNLGTCVIRTVTFNVNSDYCNQSLPVLFGDIEAAIGNGKLFVNWSTMKEVNNVGYEIEGSANGTDFKKIGSVNTKSNGGNSDEKLEYKFELPLTDVTLGFAWIAILALATSGLIGKKRKILLSAITFAIAIMIGASCNKNSNEVTEKDAEIKYVRITVDKDGSKPHSKIVKVIRE